MPIILECKELLQWYKLARRIRYCRKTDNEDIIDQYLEAGRMVIKKYSMDCAIDVYQTEYNTLMETFCDMLIPVNWRIECYKKITKPLTALNALYESQSNKSHTASLNKEYELMKNYFMPHRVS